MNIISVVIPARNEERNLPICIESLRLSAFKAKVDLEIIVVVNRSTDNTESIAKELGARVIKEETANLSRIRNAGVFATRSDIVVTVDADSKVSENMFLRINQVMKDEKNVGGGVLILPDRWSFGIVLTGLMLLPVILYYRITAGLFYFRRKDFNEIGGFNEEFVSVEDIDFAVRLKKHGAKTGRRYKNLFSAFIVTSMRKFDKFGDWYFIRNPKEFFKIFKGTDQTISNKFWYDFYQ